MYSFAFEFKLLIASLIIIFSLAYARWEEATIETEWKRIHPKPRHHPEHWNELDTIDHDVHKRICDDVMLQTLGSEEEYYKSGETVESQNTYVNASDIKKERVANISVEFIHGIGDTLVLPLVICRYKQKEFYLAQGEEDTVFKLVRDPDRGVIFKSGLHRVLYDPFKYGEKD